MLRRTLYADLEDLKQSKSDVDFFFFFFLNGESGSRPPFIKRLLGASVLPGTEPDVWLTMPSREQSTGERKVRKRKIIIVHMQQKASSFLSSETVACQTIMRIWSHPATPPPLPSPLPPSILLYPNPYKKMSFKSSFYCLFGATQFLM